VTRQYQKQDRKEATKSSRRQKQKKCAKTKNENKIG